VNDAEIQRIVALLPQRPQGIGPVIGNRAAWEALAALPAMKATLAKAEKALGEPLPVATDELYLEYSRNGSRVGWQEVAFRRRPRLPLFTLAECVENRGRFLPGIHKIISVLSAERTWVMPAHDGDLANFRGERVDIDLASSSVAWQFATVNWLLGGVLDAATAKSMRGEVERRALQPYRDMLAGRREPNWWLSTTNNWNAVCLAGVTGAALAQVEDRQERAGFVAAALQYSKNFLAGFTPDGYCSEGVGYWNYGFENFVYLAETIRHATGGGIDLLAEPAARAPSLYGKRIEIIGGVCPAFSDCHVGAKPSRQLVAHLGQRLKFAMPLKELERLSTLAELLFAYPAAAPCGGSEAQQQAAPLRDWFADAGVYIGRPAAGGRFGVALKGGHNDEHHNHNDVGSYTIVLGSREVLLDPGVEVYTARTFSKRRYDSKLLNSYGHSVPRVAGRLQETGREAQATVLQSTFADGSDELLFDLRRCYAEPTLLSLTRRFVYRRGEPAALEVSDEVKFSSPQAFETALVTRGACVIEPEGTLIVREGGEAVRVTIEASCAYRLEITHIHENAPVHPHRIGIVLESPVTAGTITVRVEPLQP